MNAIQRAADLTARAVNESRWVDATNLWSATELVVAIRTNNVDFYNILKFNTPSGKSTARSGDYGKCTLHTFNLQHICFIFVNSWLTLTAICWLQIVDSYHLDYVD